MVRILSQEVRGLQFESNNLRLLEEVFRLIGRHVKDGTRMPLRRRQDVASINIPASADNTTEYHSSCYRKLTALSAKELKSAIEKQGALDKQSASYSADSNINQPSDSGVLVKKCIRSKKTEALVVCKTESIQTSILNDAKILQHKELSDRFANVKSNLEFVAKEERCRKLHILSAILILNANRKPLPTKIKPKDIKRGEIRIQALCDDCIFAVTNGVFKPKTHLELAIAQRIDLVGEMYKLYRNSSTASGKDTLHDTFGIVIQDIPTDGEMVLSESKYNDPEDNEESRKWRRKTLFARHNDIAPYHKQPKIFNEPILELGNLR
ncbi:Uncharacterized protein APZ42_031827 [Daphnia magna]|uniref:Uncharacterized protein n=1 Tax=Daphnia magna TaxID=35525 RepID=A0A164MHV9_9CRUS|nr:Uncharacterized protein APZ42_031827 [Daphnia magna]